MTADGAGARQEHLTEVVPAALADQRIDRVVALMAGVSRREAGDALEQGVVTIDGAVVVKPSIRVVEGQTVGCTVVRRATGPRADPSVEVPVVHEDPDVLVVDKPAGLVVHPGAGTEGSTMVNGLLARYPELGSVGEPDRPGIVHRLDRGTSGLLAVARTERAYHSLVDQLAERTVLRRYRTLVAGHVEADGGLIDAPLGRSPRQATVRAVVADGRPARTRYEVVARRHWPDGPDGEPEPVTELACRLETGRTHQIRAHLAAIGHPVVGDTDYGGPDLGGLAVKRRPFLHAEHLGFEHPADGAPVFLTSELPADLDSILDRTRPAG